MQCTVKKRGCGVVKSPKLKVLGEGSFGKISKIHYGNKDYAAKNTSDLMAGILDVSVGVLVRHENVMDIENVRTGFDCDISGLFFTSGVYTGIDGVLERIKLDPCRYIMDVIRGLRALEKVDCYHFDLKLDNLLYTDDRVLVADLGGCHFMLRVEERRGVWVSSTVTHAPLSIYSSLRNFKIGWYHSVFALGVLAAEFVLGERYDILHSGGDRSIFSNIKLSESKNTRERLAFLERGLAKSNGVCRELIMNSIECLRDRSRLYSLPKLVSYLSEDVKPVIFFPDLCSVDIVRFKGFCGMISAIGLGISVSMILCTGVAVLIGRDVEDAVIYGYIYLGLCAMDLIDSMEVDPDPDFKLEDAVSILGGMLVPFSVADLCKEKEEMFLRVIEFLNRPKNFSGEVICKNWSESFSSVIEPESSKISRFFARNIK